PQQRSTPHRLLGVGAPRQAQDGPDAFDLFVEQSPNGKLAHRSCFTGAEPTSRRQSSVPRDRASVLIANIRAAGLTSAGLDCPLVAVPSLDTSPPESFRGLLLRHRGRTGLLQRELATRAGVSLRSVQEWEAGDKFPTAERLQ